MAMEDVERQLKGFCGRDDAVSTVCISWAPRKAPISLLPLATGTCVCMFQVWLSRRKIMTPSKTYLCGPYLVGFPPFMFCPLRAPPARPVPLGSMLLKWVSAVTVHKKTDIPVT